MSRPDRVALNCEILKDTDDFLRELKERAANDRGVARLSYGWVIDELVRMHKQKHNSTKSLQEIAHTDKVQ